MTKLFYFFLKVIKSYFFSGCL